MERFYLIEYVKGFVNYIDPKFIVIDVKGIGYQIFCPNPFVYQIDLVAEITVYTYQYVREDSIKLFGFRSREERVLFEKLLNVSGIGPKGALAILAYGESYQVVKAIEEENEQFLLKFPGVGKKTARQIILDLKGKLTEFSTSQTTGTEENSTNTITYSQQLEDAIEALQALGYVEREIKKIAPKLADESLSTDEYIRKALQLLLKM